MNAFNLETEKPFYVLPQVKKRVIIPKIVFLIILSFIFYLGVLLNLSLLEITAQEETTVKTIVLIILVFLIIAGTYLTVHQAGSSYLFYHNQIQFNKKKLNYADIIEIQPRKNIFDRWFKTYSLRLSRNFSLQNIPQELDLQEYLQQLQSYTKNSA